MVCVVPIRLKSGVLAVGERTEICEELDIGGSNPLPVTDRSKNCLFFRGSGRTAGNGGVHIGELAPAHLRSNPFRPGVVVLGVALRGDDEVRGGIQRGTTASVVDSVGTVNPLLQLYSCQFVRSFSSRIVGASVNFRKTLSFPLRLLTRDDMLHYVFHAAKIGKKWICGVDAS